MHAIESFYQDNHLCCDLTPYPIMNTSSGDSCFHKPLTEKKVKSSYYNVQIEKELPTPLFVYNSPDSQGIVMK